MSKSLEDRIAALMAKGAELSAQAIQPKTSLSDDKTKTNMPEALPVCGDEVRAVPNIALRGALFGVVGKGARKYENKALKATINGIVVYYTGQQLDQADLDVWAECLRLNDGVSLGVKIEFSSNSFLARVGRSQGKANREWLHDSLRRLMASVVELGDGECFYAGQLLQHWYRDDKTGKNTLLLNAELLPFFQSQKWTGLAIEQRHVLIGKPLAQWLHAFYSTHQQPFPYKVETLKGLCGSDVKHLYQFKYKLKKSLADLSTATGWVCSIDERDLVHVVKPNAVKAKPSAKGKKL